MVLACGAFAAAALDHPRLLLTPTPPLPPHYGTEDPSKVMDGGTSPGSTFRKILEGAVSSDDTFPMPANAADLMHPSAAEETEVTPTAAAPKSF